MLFFVFQDDAYGVTCCVKIESGVDEKLTHVWPDNGNGIEVKNVDF